MLVNSLEAVSECPACCCDRLSFIYSAEWNSIRADYSRCAECQYIFQNPKFSRDTLLSFYSSDEYWGVRNGSTEPSYMYDSYTDQARQFARDACTKYKIIMDHIDNPDPCRLSLLEVGCGCGFAMKVFSDAGMEVLGIEPSKSMGEVARNLRLPCVLDTIEDFEGDLESFDLVVSWGTSMNFHTPVDVYSKIFSLLKTKGVFAFDFFDAASPFYFLTRPKRNKGVHITGCPTSASVTAMLKRAGFAKVRMVRYTPRYSVSFIGSQLDSVLTKRIARWPVVRRIAIPVPGVGCWLAVAEKAN